MSFSRGLAWAVAALVGIFNGGPLIAADAPFAPKPGQGTFLVLADIHFDPFTAPGLAKALYGAPISRWSDILRKRSPKAFSPFGQDSNYALFDSALKESKSAQPGYDFVLLLGDVLSHDFEQNAEAALGSKKAASDFAIQTSRFVAAEVERRFGAVPVIPAIGNNDDNCGDYAIEPDGAYLKQLAKAWHVFRSDAAAQRGFIRLGSYTVRNPAVAKHRIVVLNSVFFSREYEDTCRPKDSDPGTETLDWLEAQLSDAANAGDQVTLAMHIPPGFDGFASASAGACGAVPLWLPDYEARFRRLTTKYRGLLALGFAGHLHMDQFRVSGGAARNPYLPIHIVPSISPVFFNNPGFTVFLYNRASGSAVDYAVLYAQLNAAPPNPPWRLEYKWSQAYGFGRVSAGKLWALSTQIGGGKPFDERFKAFFQVRARQTIAPDLWQSYVCSLTEETTKDFVACRCPAP